MGCMTCLFEAPRRAFATGAVDPTAPTGIAAATLRDCEPFL